MLTSLRAFLLLIAVFALSLTAQAQTPPTKEQILEWWVPTTPDATSLEELFTLSEDHPLIEIRLRNKEVAYIAKANFIKTTRTFPSYILIRPALKEAREIQDYYFVSIDHVYDFNQDGTSEIVINSFIRKCNGTTSIQQIIQFNGWETVVLHQAVSKNKIAWSDDPDPSYYKEVDWQFIDLNNDGIIDLDEIVTHEEGNRDEQNAVITIYRYQWIFNGNRFIRMHESGNLLSYKTINKPL